VVELAEIFRQAGSAYRRAFRGRLPPSHRRALTDIAQCRTPALGGSVYQCDDCGTLDYSYHSCRNRHCPKCQDDRAQDWLDRLRVRLLPCGHYLITFTLPAALRPLARSHPKIVYAILMRAAATTVQTITADRGWLGGQPAILAVLHTWTRALEYHPHVHLLVSAGGLSPDGTAWIKPAFPRFLAPGYVLSPIFRAKVRDALRRTELHHQVDPRVWTTDWCVHVKQAGNGEQAALYLSRYVYRVALTNQRIECFEDDKVTFTYRHARTREIRRRNLPVQQFIGLFLQHVLPRGFSKIRYYGLLSPSCRPDLERARRLLDSVAQPPARSSASTAQGAACSASTAADEPLPDKPHRPCRVCGRGHLILKETSWRPRGPARSRAPP
jgi:hypothetical protein